MQKMLFQNIVNELQFKAVRSRGPGGQNVNKVSSAAFMTWDFWKSKWLSDAQKLMIAGSLGNIINSENLVYLRSDEFRDLERNKIRCIEKLELLISKTFLPRKIRKQTKPSKRAKLKRLEKKRERSDTKKLRAKLKY